MMKNEGKIKVLLSVVLGTISFIGLFYIFGLMKIVPVIGLMISLIYLINQVFAYLSKSSKTFSMIKSSSGLTPKKKLIRDLLTGIPLFTIGFIVMQTPLVPFLFVVFLIVVTKAYFDEKRKTEQEDF